MSLDWLEERFRKIHMDFHTAPWLRETGSKFDAKTYVNTLASANVNVVVIFSKGHHGMSFYNTKIGTKHPALDYDLFGEILEEAHKQDIKVWCYHSVIWDNLIGPANPDWRMLDAEGDKVMAGNWTSLCINSPYVPEYLWRQVEEIVNNYPVDGMWFDIVFFPSNTCFCEHCLKAMKAEGMDPRNLKEHQRFNNLSVERFLKGTTNLVKSINPEVAVAYNNMIKIGARSRAPYLDKFEIESLPHAWGFLYLPLYSRYIRNLGKPMDGVTARFHRSWADFGSLKSVAMLKYECATMLANGGTCSIGDQCNPTGRLEPAVYETIGEAYQFVKEREKWCLRSKSIPYIAILADEDRETMGTKDIGMMSLFGATKMLIENHYHFDIIDKFSDLTPFKAIVLPDNQDLSEEAILKLKEFVASGGALLASGIASLSNPDKTEADFELKDLFGVKYAGPGPYTIHYLRVKNEAIGKNLPEMDLVVYDGFTQVNPIGDAEILAKVVYPATERKTHRFFSHAQAPASYESAYPAVVMNRYGKGKVIYLSAPLFNTYYTSNNPVYRKLVKNALDMIIEDKVLIVEVAISVEVSLLEQDNNWIVHLVNYHSEKRGEGREIIEEIPVVTDIKVRVKKTFEPARIYLAPSEEEIEYSEENGYLEVTVPSLHIHQMIVIEKK